MRILKKIAVTALLCSASIAVAIPLAPVDLNPGSAPSPGDANILTWLNGLITTYNTANPGANLPVANAQLAAVSQGDTPPVGFPSFGAGTLSFSVPLGVYEYITIHWGGQGQGTAAVWDAYWIGNNFGNNATFTAPSQNGLSTYRLYDTVGRRVPDGGATVGLLGLALLGLGTLRSRFAVK